MKELSKMAHGHLSRTYDWQGELKLVFSQQKFLFFHTKMWVQVYDLPCSFMLEKILEILLALL